MLDNIKSKKPATRHAGHESVLHTFAKNSTKVTIAVGEYFFEGTVRAYDRYTISLQDESGKVRIFFKSAISYFASGNLPEASEAAA